MTVKISSLEQAEQYLLQYSPQKLSGETYTLGRMKELMMRLGDPQNSIPAVHIAGTSGKTSTTYFVRALLEARGKRTGLIVSPHIESITERVQVDSKPLSPAAFLNYLNEFIGVISAWNDLQPTYFELLVAFAFWVFEKEKVDYIVVEVGLGGLLDGTNVIAREDKISVITPIGLDHTQILGETITDIATQKAGIILPHTTVFSAQQYPEARLVIESVSRQSQSKVLFVESRVDASSDVPLFQQANFELARQAVEFISKRDNLPAISSADELACLRQSPPGRFEIFTSNGKLVVLDGAHNPQKLEAFLRSFESRFPSVSATWLVGFIDAPDAKITSCVKAINRPNDDYVFTNFRVGQDIKGRVSIDATDLLELAQQNHMSAAMQSDYELAFEQVLQSEKRTVIVTGSLYLVAKVRRFLKADR